MLQTVQSMVVCGAGGSWWDMNYPMHITPIAGLSHFANCCQLSSTYRAAKLANETVSQQYEAKQRLPIHNFT